MEAANEIALRQEEIGKKISNLLTNMKKDPQQRKTPEYVQKREECLTSFMDEAEANHDEFLKLNFPGHNYITKNYFDAIKSKYKEAKKYLQTSAQTQPTTPAGHPLTNQPPATTTTSATLDLQEIQLRKQQAMIDQLKSSLQTANEEYHQETTKRRQERLKSRIEDQWKATKELYLEIIVHLTNNEDIEFQSNQQEDLQDNVEDVLDKLQDKISEMNSEKTKIPLPKAQLPYFSGGYEEWTTFHDIFEKMIHTNTTLSKVEKMQYLKTHIRSEASKLVQHLHITENNYEAAWELLCRRYHNKRVISNKFMDTILHLPKIQEENYYQLRQMYNVIHECLEAIKNLGINTDLWGTLVGRIITLKWDNDTNKFYEQTLPNPTEIQPLSSIMAFLERRCQSLESTKKDKKTGNYSNNKNDTKISKCGYCQEQHLIIFCKKFQQLSPVERQKAAQEKKLCYNCLNHDTSKQCHSKSTCKKCSRSHHTLLHRENSKPTNQQNKSTNKVSNTTQMKNNKQEKIVLLTTALLRTYSSSGNVEHLRVLIDSGSQAALITEQAAQLLGHPRQKSSTEVTGLGGEEPKKAKGKIQTQIISRFPSEFSMDVNFFVLPKLTKTMPDRKIHYEIPEEWKNHLLADPTFNEPGPIDAILGAEEVGKIIEEGLKKTEDGLLAQKSKLGWLLSGSIYETQPREIISMVSRFEEDQQLTKFWEIEEISEEKPLSKENSECEKHYETTTSRKLNGKFTVKIPFKQDPTQIGTSRSKTLARFFQLEKKLQRDKNLQEQYHAFMDEYKQLGHMKIVSTSNTGNYYIPHQPVIREDSTTTKLRVVFDASSKTTNGKSLNEMMHVGPRLQQEIRDILLRWRKHQIVFNADIEKMYRQIDMDEEDQKYQHIFWRTSPAQPLEEYRLTTVTYGTTSAPYLAVKTLQKLAQEEKHKYPTAARIIMEDFYVDDLISGADTITEAVQIQSDIITILKSGGFNLRKWASNKQEILNNLPAEQKDKTITEITEKEMKKTLGVYWAPHDDVFKFKTEIKPMEKLTKRTILSEIAKLYDPLGWLSPVIIQAKLFIQELWVANINWDENLPASIQEKWINFHQHLKCVEQLTIPRWINYSSTNEKTELHGFCDASEKAYGAVVYVRTIREDKIEVTLLTAKSKVAPIKERKSLPRLELCAAQLLAKLMNHIKKMLKIENIQEFGWTDSMITLAWIQGEAHRWKTFVANRVVSINENLPAEKWRHVGSTDNPADIISRGMCPSQINDSQLWWNGPTWLHDKQFQPKPIAAQETNLEMKICAATTVNNIGNPLISRFSSFTKMLRVLAYCNRACKITKQNEGKAQLTTEDLKYTEQQVIKMIQNESFPNEIAAIKNNKQINKNSKILNLSPFLDESNILRVGGRLKHSLLPFGQKHPIILDQESHLTTLIIRHAHDQTLHGGIQQTLGYTRRKYWIVNGKRKVTKLIQRCTTCIRYKAQTASQMMGDLPAPRVTPSPPFFHTGIDYAGPISIRTTKGRGHKSYKGYIAIFVCLSTKAIHLEAVSDMTTDAFIAAFRRFTSRRGHCSHVYSDNGTNFVGANNIIKQEVMEITKDPQVQNKLVTMDTQWHFIPPAAPHFGGLWEAGVKSTKFHLKRVIGEVTLTFEEITTLLCQIEACLNSRPLCTLNNDVSEIEVITPGHFLIGRELMTPTHPAHVDLNINPNSRWRLIQKMKKDIWKSWSTEYLSKLQQKYKWQSTQPNPQINDVIIVKEDDIHPGRWPLAKIIDTHPDDTGNVRVVTIKKAEGQPVKRPIHRIIPLPTSNETDEIQKGKTKNKRNTTNMVGSLLLSMMLLVNIQPIQTEELFSVKYLDSGLYVEHLGHTLVERGIFRVETKYSIQKMEKDAAEVNKVQKEFENLCNQTKQLDSKTQCFTLNHHLKELQRQMNWIQESLNQPLAVRKRRGLLGKLMTSVFGVNDEVYEDIEKLQQNQQNVIKSTNHQTKFMISTLNTLNDTESRINQKLEQFRKKLNQGLQAVNEMRGWWSAADTNTLNVHILGSFQVANNFMEEACDYYSRLLQAKLRRGSLHDLMPPAHVNKVILEAQKKLPPTLKIIIDPIIKTMVKSDDSYIHIYSHFLIAGINNFTIIKVTSVPLKGEDNFYWVMETPNNLLAVDYDMQLYFEITEAELKDCISSTDNNYICSPVTVKNLETSPNCIINEIYQRLEPPKCSVSRRKIIGTVWKELHTSNTWLAITTTPQQIAVICNGQRQDEILNSTCIIQISQECIIRTKQNILTPKRITAVAAIASYIKTVNIDANWTQGRTDNSIQMVEPILRNSEKFQNLRKQEEDIIDELHTTTWKTIKHNSLLTSISTGAVILLIMGISFMAYLGWKRWKKNQPKYERPKNNSNPQPRVRQQQIDNTVMVELDPLA